MKKIRVVVLMGGRSGESAVSLRSGEGILGNLDYSMYEALPVVVTTEGEWLAATDYGSFGDGFDANAFVAGCRSVSKSFPERLLGSDSLPDIVFPIIHGKYGEDGTLQGMLEMYNLPYVGSRVLSSALAMHKRKAKEIYIHNKIPTPEYSFYSRRQWNSSSPTLIAHLVEKLGLPIFAKSPEGGSSIGIGFANSKESLREIADSLFVDSDEVLFEKTVKGVEVSCGVLDTIDGEPEPLLPTEIIPVSSSFFDFKAKYEKGASREVTPARISKSLTEKVQKYAVAAHNALGCFCMSRTDMIISGEAISVLETNTLPGFTPTSLLPQGAAAVGLSYPELLDRVIRVAMKAQQ